MTKDIIENVIKLYLNLPNNKKSTNAIILKVFEPFALSSMLLVRLDCPTLPPVEMVLKLFDRRFATQLREEGKNSGWNSDIEKKYHQFMTDGGASKFIAELEAESKATHENDHSWSPSQDEAYLHNHLRSLYEIEVEVYNTLKDLQGEVIPQFFSCITTPSFPAADTAQVDEYTKIHGFFLQHIEGFPV
ncbi:hypothetical protein ASPZODRAFT_133899 [Penicilliopsis zonata CBS 506.65]|uniref:Uncharacterized protein n=1 Tax=Penicilliopsis zonata CBS 506.65 TaxID=1073090 RepID=A0A1L9SDG5_9EURO|nr:hypothetical protein ASPZODRAFT_133899 [Penicilliopsis zonata CBS 506.65]OJJ45260.1 hypothetical protein ASPZODRAFT_133899 [Penicilliopsis zonata CBS 506.65]